MLNKIWFNEDGDIVHGCKSSIGSEEEFIELVQKEHLEQTGDKCVVSNVKEDVYIMTSKKLNGEWCYRFKDSGVEIKTLYIADVEANSDYQSDEVI